jgi:hypothetical protein
MDKINSKVNKYMAGSKLVRHWVLKGSCNEYFQNIRVVEVTSENESLESN